MLERSFDQPKNLLVVARKVLGEVSAQVSSDRASRFRIATAGIGSSLEGLGQSPAVEPDYEGMVTCPTSFSLDISDPLLLGEEDSRSDPFGQVEANSP